MAPTHTRVNSPESDYEDVVPATSSGFDSDDEREMEDCRRLQREGFPPYTPHQANGDQISFTHSSEIGQNLDFEEFSDMEIDDEAIAVVEAVEADFNAQRMAQEKAERKAKRRKAKAAKAAAKAAAKLARKERRKALKAARRRAAEEETNGQQMADSTNANVAGGNLELIGHVEGGVVGEEDDKKTGLTDVQKEKAYQAIRSVFMDTDIGERERNNIIWMNPQLDKHPLHPLLWRSVEQACPTVTRKRLMHWARQQFRRLDHLPSGKWTKQQETELLTRVKQHGDKWSFLGKLLNRDQRDCRERHRTIMYRGNGTATMGHWSAQEQEALLNAMETTVDTLRAQSTEEAFNAQEVIEINWDAISVALQSKRTVQQCKYKWKQILTKNNLPDQILAKLPANMRR